MWDALWWFLIGGSVLITLLVATLVVTFAVKYRRKHPDEVPAQTEGSLRLELTWTITPLVLALVVFAWSAWLYVRMTNTPDDAMEITVTGRQWMWKAQHPTGQWENNELHIPVGQPINLNMTSIDVIHDFSIPAFRTKMDVLPNRITTLPFTATRAGEYHLFCAEYCGSYHSTMVGRIVAMEPRDFQEWLSGGGSGVAPAQLGQQHFQNYGCATCHTGQASARGPNLAGIYNEQVQLQDGQTVVADDNYLRESIRNPSAKIVAGYQNIMPAYPESQISEQQLLELIAYIRSLSEGDTAPGGLSAPQNGEQPPASGAPGGNAAPGASGGGSSTMPGSGGDSSEGGGSTEGGGSGGQTSP
jgi:cytochrome c oxidase subunit 2